MPKTIRAPLPSCPIPRDTASSHEGRKATPARDLLQNIAGGGVERNSPRMASRANYLGRGTTQELELEFPRFVRDPQTARTLTRRDTSAVPRNVD